MEIQQAQPALMSKEVLAIVASAGFTFLTTICTLIYNAWVRRQDTKAAASEAQRVALVAAEALASQRAWDLAEKERQRRWDIEDRESKAREVKDELRKAQDLLASNNKNVLKQLEVAKQERQENTDLTRENVELSKAAITLNKEAINSAHEATDVSHKILEEVANVVAAKAPNMITGLLMVEAAIPEKLKTKLNDEDCDGE